MQHPRQNIAYITPTESLKIYPAALKLRMFDKPPIILTPIYRGKNLAQGRLCEEYRGPPPLLHFMVQGDNRISLNFWENDV